MKGIVMKKSFLIKRATDIVFSSMLLILLMPLLVVISIFIKLDSKGSILFTQERTGLQGMLFKIYKFRTMTQNAEKTGSKVNEFEDASRITKLGAFLRDWSLDELPQLFNVLKGDMSFIGPRPLLPEYLELYTPEQARRHEVKPGITGWAQVNGRNSISWEKKFELDVWYVDNWSIWLDFKIFLLTVKKVFAREGISASSNVTMEKFQGCNKNNGAGVE